MEAAAETERAVRSIIIDSSTGNEAIHFDHTVVATSMESPTLLGLSQLQEIFNRTAQYATSLMESTNFLGLPQLQDIRECENTREVQQGASVRGCENTRDVQQGATTENTLQCKYLHWCYLIKRPCS